MLKFKVPMLATTLLASLAAVSPAGVAQAQNYFGYDPDNNSMATSGYVTGSNSTGVLGSATGSGSIGVKAVSQNGDGLVAQVTNQAYSGVFARNFAASGTGCGVYGMVNPSSSGFALYGDADNSATAWAGYFKGRVSAQAFITQSDVRLKKDIRALSGATETMGRLRPVSYLWKDESSGAVKQIGFIAQEVEKVFPELVATDAKTGMKSVNYIGVVPVTVKAFQEQQATIQRQEAQLDGLAKRVAELEKKSHSTPLSASLGGISVALMAAGLFAARRKRSAQI